MDNKRCQKHLLAFLLTGVLLLGGVFWGTHRIPATAPPFFAPTRTSKHIETTMPRAVPAPTAPRPTRLVIPAIGVNAPVESLGVLPNGNLAVPTQQPWADVGWYQDGPMPGQVGSAVIDGHLDRPGELPAVFWNLHRLQVGNLLQVVLGDGSRVFFRVKEVHSYPPTAMPLARIFEDMSGIYLNLITCAGTWIPSQQQTSLRLVVYSVLNTPQRTP